MKKCVCRNCYKVVELSDPKYNSMTDEFWGGKCPNCGAYTPMYDLEEFIKIRDRFNSVKI